MPTVQIKPVAPMRLAEADADVAEFSESALDGVVGPLFDLVIDTLGAHSIVPVGPAVARYELGGGDGVRVHAGFPVDRADAPGLRVVDLLGVASAATLVHLGPMAGIGTSWDVLRAWVADRPDVEVAGDPREVYLEAPMGDQANWVTELQLPVSSV